MDALELGKHVRLGLESIRAGTPEPAIEHLLIAAQHPEFEKQADMRDLYARVASVLAQCFLETGEPEEAQRWLHRAMRALRELEDTEGLKEVQPLNNQILTALMHRRKELKVREELAFLAASSIDDLLEKTENDQERADILIKKANGEIEAGRLDKAVHFAEEALSVAMRCSATREIVLAHLSIARASPKRAGEAIFDAWTCAEHAEEFNLVSIIASAATQAGVAMPTLRGPNGSIS